MKNSLEQEIGVLLRERGLTIAVAESSAGGLISHLVTNVPGSSSYYKGSVIAYANEVKVKLLGVKGKTLQEHKSVSRETALEMAEGVRLAMSTDIGLSETGVAGTASGSSEKGLFYIAISYSGGSRVEEYVFHGDRLQNKEGAAGAALKMLKEYLLQL